MASAAETLRPALMFKEQIAARARKAARSGGYSGR